MKKTLKNLAALLLIAMPVFTACNKELESAESSIKEGDVTLTFLPPSQDALTKVATSETDTKFKLTGWNVGDSIFVYQTNSDHNALSDEVKFTCTDATKSTFTGSIAGKKNIAGGDLQVSELNLASTKKMNTSMEVVAADLSTFASTDFSDVCLLVGERSSSDTDFQMLLKGNVIAIDNKTAADKEAAIKVVSGGTGYSFVSPIFGYAEGAWVQFYTPGDFSDKKFTVAKNDITYVLFLVAETNRYGIGIESDGKDTDAASIAAMKSIAAGTNGKMWTVTIEDTPSVLLPGKFSVSSTTQVRFSKGNLYCYRSSSSSSEWTWGFYANQYQYNSLNTSASRTAAEDNTEIDHFCWGYDASGSVNPVESVSRSSFTDWGQNISTLPGNSASTKIWKTLSKDEWNYLLNKRTVNGGTKEGYSYKRTTLTLSDNTTTVYGMIIAPDNYTGSLSGSTPWSDWQTMESAGCVFLPAAGARDGSGVDNVGSYGCYWSSTSSYNECAQYLFFYSNNSFTMYSSGRNYGYSVRLVSTVSE